MREIKFRVWDSKKMIGNNLDIEDLMSGILLFKPSFIWMQFTGLKDGKGIEVYKGDILRTPCKQTFYIKKPNVHGLGAEMGKRETVGIVVCEWDSYGFKFRHINKGMYNISVPKFEIIGNIYENPELLKG